MRLYLKFAIRQLVKNKVIAFGSIFSLIMGVLCPYVIYLWVQSEVRADQFHSEYENIHVVAVQQNAMAKPRPSMASYSADLSSYAEVEKKLATRTYAPNEVKLTVKESEFSEKGMVVDSTFFDFFDFQVMQGERENLLHDPDQIVITESLAKKMFGDKMPIGETVKLEAGNEVLYSVAAVLKDIPTNSSIQFDFLVPTHSQRFWARMGVELLLVNNAFDKTSFEKRFTTDVQSNERTSESIGSLYAFSDIYFDNPFNHSLFARSGDRNNVYVISVIAMIILVISLVNFTNLQITQMTTQFKSTSIKMVNGASKKDLLLETFLVNLIYSVFATLVGVLLLFLVQPYLENLLDKSFQLNFLGQVGVFLILSILFSNLTLIYTAIQVWGNRTSVMLTQSSIGNLGFAKKGVTVIQFICAIVLMFSSLVIYRQFNYLTNKDLGYDYANVLSVKLIDEFSYSLPREEVIKKMQEQKKNFQLVQSTFESEPSLVGLSQGDMPLTRSAYPMSWKLLGGMDDYTTHNLMTVDPSYADLLDLVMVKGRFFSDSLDQSRGHQLVINEAAMKYFNINDIEGVKIANESWGKEKEPFEVIGVVKDYHYEHLSNQVKPLMLTFMQDNESNFLFRLNDQRTSEALASLERLHAQIKPGKAFEYTLLEDEILKQYAKEKRLSVVILVFTSVALLISVIGLFTLALYDTQRRIKEVGVRRVLGASVQSLVSLLTYSFIKWVLLALLIGIPVAYVGSDAWLRNFANRIDIDLGILLITSVSVVGVSFLTIITQTYITAKRNPVDSLRYE